MSHGNYNDYDVSQSQIDKQTDGRTDGWMDFVIRTKSSRRWSMSTCYHLSFVLSVTEGTMKVLVYF